MEKMCGPVSLGDYVAPLGSGLRNASNPVLSCHHDLEDFVTKRLSIPPRQLAFSVWMSKREHA